MEKGYVAKINGIPIIKDDISNAKEGILIHQVNCKGVMGSGVALDIKNHFPINYLVYEEKCRVAENSQDLLGKVIFTFEHDKIIANIFGQDSYGRQNIVYTDYDALLTGLQAVAIEAKREKLSIAVPFIVGCGRGNGDKNVILKMLQEVFHGIEWAFYTGRNSTLDIEKILS